MNSMERRLLFQCGGEHHIYLGENYSGYVKPHSHQFTQCLLLIEGNIIQRQGGKEYNQQPGDLFFTPSGVEHSLLILTPDTRYYCLSVSEELTYLTVARFPGMTADWAGMDCMVRPDEHTAYMLSSLFDLLLRESKITIPERLSAGHFLTASAFMLALRACYKENELREPENEHSSGGDIRAIVQFIDSNYTQPMTIQDLATRINMSPTYFCRVFKQTTGETAMHYITRKRIHAAIMYVHNKPNMTYTEIFEKVGYSDFSTFFRNFKKIMGVSPNEYRNQSVERRVVF